MKKSIKIIAAIMSVILLAGALFACTKDNNQEPSNNTNEKKKVGIIQYASHPSLDNCYEGIIKGLKEAGFVDGENITIDFQNAQNNTATVSQIAKSMTSKKYDVIFAIATPSAAYTYADASAANVPLVFCAVNDPVSAQLVPSMEKGGDIATGTSDVLNLDEQFKLIRACQPEAKKIGILYTASETNSVSTLKRAKEIAPKYGFEIVEQSVQQSADIAQAATSLSAKVDCINNFTDNNVVENLQIVLAKAKEAGIPVYGSEIEQVKNGCLASASIDYVAVGQKTGAMGAKILNGATTASIVPETIQEAFLVINTDVMKAYNITSVEGLDKMQQITSAESN